MELDYSRSSRGAESSLEYAHILGDNICAVHCRQMSLPMTQSGRLKNWLHHGWPSLWNGKSIASISDAHPIESNKKILVNGCLSDPSIGCLLSTSDSSPDGCRIVRYSSNYVNTRGKNKFLSSSCSSVRCLRGWFLNLFCWLLDQMVVTALNITSFVESFGGN